MKEAGFEIVELGSDTANWDKVQATDKMKGFISAASRILFMLVFVPDHFGTAFVLIILDF